jgi:uncharacterized membrane protein YphA (DoxX/SURF4 family)
MASANDVQQHRPAVDWALLVIRLVVGTIFVAHGAQKLFGAFGGPGFEYNLALIGLLAPILIAGPGRFTIGQLLPLPRAPKTGRPHPVLE